MSKFKCVGLWRIVEDFEKKYCLRVERRKGEKGLVFFGFLEGYCYFFNDVVGFREGWRKKEVFSDVIKVEKWERGKEVYKDRGNFIVVGDMSL